MHRGGSAWYSNMVTAWRPGSRVRKRPGFHNAPQGYTSSDPEPFIGLHLLKVSYHPVVLWARVQAFITWLLRGVPVPKYSLISASYNHDSCCWSHQELTWSKVQMKLEQFKTHFSMKTCELKISKKSIKEQHENFQSSPRKSTKWRSSKFSNRQKLAERLCSHSPSSLSPRCLMLNSVCSIVLM